MTTVGILAIALGLGVLAPVPCRAAEVAEVKRDGLRQLEEDAARALANVEREIGRLEKRLETLREESRERLERALEELEHQRRIVRRRLDALRARGGDAWKEFRSGLEAALEELRKALRDAGAEAEVTET